MELQNFPAKKKSEPENWEDRIDFLLFPKNPDPSLE